MCNEKEVVWVVNVFMRPLPVKLSAIQCKRFFCFNMVWIQGHVNLQVLGMCNLTHFIFEEVPFFILPQIILSTKPLYWSWIFYQSIFGGSDHQLGTMSKEDCKMLFPGVFSVLYVFLTWVLGWWWLRTKVLICSLTAHIVLWYVCYGCLCISLFFLQVEFVWLHFYRFSIFCLCLWRR